VTGSLVMDGAVIEAGVVLRDSIVGPGAHIAAGASVTDLSVLGKGYAVEAGAVLSEARLPLPA
jgi:mannose-1-phosphate guanylyltransferase